MYYKVSDFMDDWNYESEATLKLFRTLSDKSLSQKVWEEGRTLGDLAWHITTSVGEMLDKTGLKNELPQQMENIPNAVAEFVATYEKASAFVKETIPAKWKDETLLEEVNMYGENWKNGRTLSVLLGHQIHHRGQLTVLMRQAGLKVPGIYGPAKEEWAAYGMPAQK